MEAATVDSVADPAFLLQPFATADAACVASWVRTREEAFMLAPGTAPPIDAGKVVAWTARRGQGYMIRRRGEDAPLGYAELNWMGVAPRHYWIGHVVIDPARRGNGLGRGLTAALCDYAFRALSATRLTLVVFPTNEPAIRCYRACGFRQVREEFQRFHGRRYRLLRFERGAPASSRTVPPVDPAVSSADSAAAVEPAGDQPERVSYCPSSRPA